MPDEFERPEAEPVVEAATETLDAAVDAATDVTGELRAATEHAVDELQSLQEQVIETVTASQQEAIETVETARRVVLQAMDQVRSDLSDFVAERIRQDLDVQQAFLRCRSFGEVREVQYSFLRTALGQYGGEAQKLARLSGEVATRTLDRPRA